MSGMVRLVRRNLWRQNEIVSDLRQRIVSGKLKPGDRMPTVVDLEAKFGSSTKTIQRAVDYLRRTGYAETRRRKGTYVAAHPPHLCHVGIVAAFNPRQDNVHSSYLFAWEREMDRMADIPDPVWNFSLYYSSDLSNGPHSRAALMEAVNEQRFAGLIFPFPLFDLNGTPVMQDADLPRVMVSTSPVGKVTTLVLDYAALLERGLAELASKGCRRVAFLLSSQGNPYGSEEDLIRFTATHGMQTCRRWIHGTDAARPQWASNTVEMLFHRAGDAGPDGLFILDDNFVPPASLGLLAAGVRVPDDVHVVAMANFPHPTECHVPARRIGFSVSAMIEAGTDCIRRMRQGESVAPVITLPVFCP